MVCDPIGSDDEAPCDSIAGGTLILTFQPGT